MNILSNEPKLTVAICTHNRQQLLADSLDSLLGLPGAGALPWEALIVDNASTDGTWERAHSYMLAYPDKVRYVFEPTPGLSRSRNTAIAAARGIAIAFIDDDVYLGPTWCDAVFAALTAWPEVSCFGGKVSPRFECAKPEWLEAGLLAVYGHIDLGQDVCRFHYPEHPFGCNMIFRRSVFDRVGTFSVSLGRTPGSLLSNEESHLFYRLAQAGQPVLYLPEALVYHRIPAARLTDDWVVARYYWQGRSNAVFQQMVAPRPRTALWHCGWSGVTEAIGEFRERRWSPRRIYWLFKKLPVWQQAEYATRIGMGIGEIRHAIGLR